MRVSSILSLFGLASLAAAAPVSEQPGTLAERDVSLATIMGRGIAAREVARSVLMARDDSIPVAVNVTDDGEPIVDAANKFYATWHPSGVPFAQQCTLNGVAMLLQLWIGFDNNLHWILDTAFPGGADSVRLGITDLRTLTGRDIDLITLAKEYILAPAPGTVWKAGDPFKFTW